VDVASSTWEGDKLRIGRRIDMTGIERHAGKKTGRINEETFRGSKKVRPQLRSLESSSSVFQSLVVFVLMSICI